MDRFRDRFTLAGAKDDSREAEVMASALRTDPKPFFPSKNLKLDYGCWFSVPRGRGHVAFGRAAGHFRQRLLLS